jgi:hypothetical protein
MNKTPNWKSLDLNNKCGSCNYYKAFIKNNVLTARGTCTLKTVYKMRTESCLKFEESPSNHITQQRRE